MKRYVAFRLIQGVIALFIASVVVFGLARLTGNPLDMMLEETTTEEDFKAMEEYLGFDKPLPVQYWVFISNVAKGDLGRSLRYRRPVIEHSFHTPIP